jgi:uncharacterized protein YlxW (UPF0749 family)
MSARHGSGQVAIALTVALLGFLLATQLRAQQGLAQRLQIERESDLGQILSQLSERNDRLFEEIVDLRVRLAESAGSEGSERALEEGARQQIFSLEVLLGTVPVAGPGVSMAIGDPQGNVGPEALLDVVQELRDAGAEAIEIGGTRIVAQTAFTGDTGALALGARTVRAPYLILAIGDPATLAEAMRIPGGVADSVEARPGASVRIEERASVSILSTAAAPSFRFARPRR